MDEILLGKCGFYCGCCPTYIKGSCRGCSLEPMEYGCYSRDCVNQKGLSCCGECEQFPCDIILTKPRTTILDRSWLLWKKNADAQHGA